MASDHRVTQFPAIANLRPIGAAAVALGLGLAPATVAPTAKADVAPLARPVASRAVAVDRAISVIMLAGESLAAALVRAGLSPGEAQKASSALADEVDVVNPHPSLVVRLNLSADRTPRLDGLSLRPTDTAAVTLRRNATGGFSVQRFETAQTRDETLVTGRVDGSLYLSLVEAHLDPVLAAKVADLFGARVDLARDVESGDSFRLLLGPAAAASAGLDELVYAEVATARGVQRLYRVREGSAGLTAIDLGDFAEASGRPSRVGLLRTPVAGARVTSGFGLRMHPLLGFTRMHQGVDFGAPKGSPVLAAADGVVEEARWAGGYGRWLKIRHGPGLETGYGHLSAWAQGVGPGTAVRQGQVVAYVGESGLATGPHLHFEVFQGGRQVDPAAAAGAASTKVAPVDSRFAARKASIDAAVARLSAG